MQAHELWSTTRCTRPKLPFTRAQTMAPFMLKHDGKLNRWCPVQEDVEDYFRKTLGEVRACPPPRLTPRVAVNGLAGLTWGA